MIKIKDKEDEDEEKTIPYLRYYNVFHISQVKGVEPIEVPAKEFVNIPDADVIIKNYCDATNLPIINEASNSAFYSIRSDQIHLPELKQFKSEDLYYSTAFHELIHSTGHPDRLGRVDPDDIAKFGSERYGKEELIAEIGSAALMSYLGIQTSKSFNNNVAYLQNWISALKNDKKLIVSATSKAEAAVKLILSATFVDDPLVVS